MKSWDTMSILGFVHPGALISLQGMFWIANTSLFTSLNGKDVG